MTIDKGLAIFDVCNTLYDSNTTFDFITFVVKRKLKQKRFLLKALTVKYSPIFFGWTALGKLRRKDLIREKAVRLLKGLKKEELLTLAESFYKEYLQGKEIAQVMNMLKEACQHHEVWLFSNSIEPVIQNIAQKLDVYYEATELEYDDNGVFTGKIGREMSGRKKEAFVSRFGSSAFIRFMCSDNKSDHEMLKLAKTSFVVVYSEAEKKFWRTLNPNFIELY